MSFFSFLCVWDFGMVCSSISALWPSCSWSSLTTLSRLCLASRSFSRSSLSCSRSTSACWSFTCRSSIWQTLRRNRLECFAKPLFFMTHFQQFFSWQTCNITWNDRIIVAYIVPVRNIWPSDVLPRSSYRIRGSAFLCPALSSVCHNTHWRLAPSSHTPHGGVQSLSSGSALPRWPLSACPSWSPWQTPAPVNSIRGYWNLCELCFREI